MILRSQDLTSPHGGSTWKRPQELPASRVIEVLTQVGVDKHPFVNPNRISNSSHQKTDSGSAKFESLSLTAHRRKLETQR
jgi:hypothetical protein